MIEGKGLRFGRREGRATIAGVLLYAGTSWLGNIFPLEASDNVDIRLGIAVPIFMGFAYGPMVGFLTGFLGNLLGDYWSGWIAYPPDPPSGRVWVDVARGYVLHWQMGNGIMGLVPGLSALRYDRFSTWKDQLRSLVVTALGVVAGTGFASLANIPLEGRDYGYAFSQLFLPAVQTNLLSAALTVPVLLYNYARLDLRTTEWLRSGLMKQLLAVILVSAALPVLLLGLLLVQHTAGAPVDRTELAVKLVLTIVLTLAFTVANAALLAQNLSRPLVRLTDAARLVEANQLTTAQARALEEHHDPGSPVEIARLSTVFGRMAREVIQREERLRRQVEQLRIEIDRTRQQEQVREITDTDFFQNLASRAQEMRRQRQKVNFMEQQDSP